MRVKRYAMRSLLTATLVLGATSFAKAEFYYCYSDDGATVYFSSLAGCPAADPVTLGARFSDYLVSRGKRAGSSLCPREGNRSAAVASRDKDIEGFRKPGRELYFDQHFVGSCVR
jgi:hypothetical protein